MIFLALVGIIFATDPLTVRDLSIEYLRTFDCEIAPEKAYLVDQAEILFTKMAVMESRNQNEDRLKIMIGWTDFVASILDRTDLEERDINIISGEMIQIEPFNRFFNLTSVSIELHYRILGLTGIDVLSHMHPDTIDNQALIRSILKKVSLSTIEIFDDSHRWLVDKSPNQLVFMDHAATFLINDCLRIQEGNPDVLIICYPMHSLLRMDLTGMTVKDLMMGPQYEAFERTVETLRPLSGAYYTRINFYELFVMKRKLNPGSVTSIIERLLATVETIGAGLYYPWVELGGANTALKAITDCVPGNQKDVELDDKPIDGGLASVSLRAVLSRLELTSIPNFGAIRETLDAWRGSGPTPHLMLIVVRELLKQSELRDGDSFIDRSFKGLSVYIPTGPSQLNFLISKDPRIKYEVTEEYADIMERFRRPSFLFKSIRPHFNALLELCMPGTNHPLEHRERVVNQASRILFFEKIKRLVDINFIPELVQSVLSLPCHHPDIEREFRELRLEISATRDPGSRMTGEAMSWIFELSNLIPSHIIMYNFEFEKRSRLEEIADLCNSLIALPNMRTRHFSPQQFETLNASKNELVVAMREARLDTVSAETIGSLIHVLGALIQEFSRE
jgi:hypothetical protein